MNDDNLQSLARVYADIPRTKIDISSLKLMLEHEQTILRGLLDGSGPQKYPVVHDVTVARILTLQSMIKDHSPKTGRVLRDAAPKEGSSFTKPSVRELGNQPLAPPSRAPMPPISDDE